MRKHPHAPISRGFLAVAMFFCVMLTGCQELVPRQQYNDTQADLARLRNENAELQKRLKEAEATRDGYFERLNTVQNQRKENLIVQLRAANRRADAMEKVGFDRGALAVYKSIQIVGRPYVVRGILIDDWYYDFTVQINGHQLSVCRVATKQECGPVVEGLSAVSSVAVLLQ